MAVYDLDRLSVLLAEDNRFVRDVLEQLLRHFRIGQIEVATNGQQAIEFLKTSASPDLRTLREIDIVIADMLMSPVDGLLLLKWIRQSKDSPNRFLPVIMISGAADSENVSAARDLGVNEFLAKPFSAQTVYKRLLSVIDFPRPYIATHSYFGPERRRKKEPFEGEEKRQTPADAISVVYSAEKVVRPSKQTEVWHFRFPNTLKEKIAGLGASGGGELPLDLLEEADSELERSVLDFTEWATDYLASLAKLCDKIPAKPLGQRRKEIEEINLLAHELRGQGGTFGYPLITVFGKMLYNATLPGCREDDSMVEVVRAHIDAMRAVLRDKVSGDGGKLGRELLASLKQAIARHTSVT